MSDGKDVHCIPTKNMVFLDNKELIERGPINSSYSRDLEKYGNLVEKFKWFDENCESGGGQNYIIDRRMGSCWAWKDRDSNIVGEQKFFPDPENGSEKYTIRGLDKKYSANFNWVIYVLLLILIILLVAPRNLRNKIKFF
ncbi:hypothetical protein N9C10_01515 [Flavobacteriaceae bacterium]|nr:hypothetical protein [Flavobacteriaceae bacterium]